MSREGQKMELEQMKAKLAVDKKDLDKKIQEIELKQQEIEESKVKSILGTGTEANKAPDVFTSKLRSDSYEAKLLGTFKAKNFQDLIATNTNSPKYAAVPAEQKIAVMQIKEAVDISRYIAQIYFNGARDGSNFLEAGGAACKTILESNYAKEHLVPLLKSFNTGVASTGGAWIPTLISSSFQEEYQLAYALASATQVMPMASNPFELPVQDGVTTARIIAEAATQTDSNFTTSVISWSAKKTGEYYIVPSELDQDSIAPILSIARGEVVKSQIRAREQVLVNGDDTGAGHMDSDVVAASDARKLAKGYRKLALANSATVDFAGTVSAANLDQLRISMGKFGVNPRELVYVFGSTGYGQAVSLDEVSSLDKVGTQATLLTGSLAQYRGINVLVSEFCREDLNANGVYDGVTTTKTVCHLVNATRFWLGVRKPIMTKVAVSDPEEDTVKLASYSRWDFKGHAQSATEASCVLGINISLS